MVAVDLLSQQSNLLFREDKLRACAQVLLKLTPLLPWE